jgi:hypothetical protein
MDNIGKMEKVVAIDLIDLNQNINTMAMSMADEQDKDQEKDQRQDQSKDQTKDQTKNQTYDEIIVLLDQIMNDRTVPKNIRKAAEDSKAVLQGIDTSEMKISTAISILDEITNDPNMPMYTRTQIWNAVSMLEQKRREI